MFQLCNMACIAGMGDAHWLGIEPVAIHAAVKLLRIRPDDWPDVAHDVAYMGQVVAGDWNRKAASKRR